MSKEDPIIVSLGINGIYPTLLNRLRESCLEYNVGHWLWRKYPSGARSHAESPYGFKTFVIKQALQKGFKTIVWADSAVYIVKDPSPFFQLVREKGIVIFGRGPPLEQWVSDKSLRLFGLERSNVKDHCLVCGALFGFNFGHKTTNDFFKELCIYEKDNWFRNDGQRPKEPFETHRHDEAIMSLMTIKYKIELVDYSIYFQGNEKSVMFRAKKSL